MNSPKQSLSERVLGWCFGLIVVGMGLQVMGGLIRPYIPWILLAVFALAVLLVWKRGDGNGW